mgnify:CR=1 FL=1
MIDLSITIEEEDAKLLLEDSNTPTNEENIKAIVEGEIANTINQKFRQENMALLKNIVEKYVSTAREVIDSNKDKFEGE